MDAQGEPDLRPLTAWSVEVRANGRCGSVVVLERGALAAWFSAVEMMGKLGIVAEVGAAVPWRG